jgi:hypothetical protein
MSLTIIFHYLELIFKFLVHDFELMFEYIEARLGILAAFVFELVLMPLGPPAVTPQE